MFRTSTSFQFGLNGAPVIAPADPNITITIQDRLNNTEVIIRPISPYKTNRSLGTEQGTSKNQKTQHVRLMKTSGTHNRKLACSAMSTECAWVHYTAVFLSSGLPTKHVPSKPTPTTRPTEEIYTNINEQDRSSAHTCPCAGIRSKIIRRDRL
jgi:hypothetical protein